MFKVSLLLIYAAEVLYTEEVRLHNVPPATRAFVSTFNQVSCVERACIH